MVHVVVTVTAVVDAKVVVVPAEEAAGVIVEVAVVVAVAVVAVEAVLTHVQVAVLVGVHRVMDAVVVPTVQVAVAVMVVVVDVHHVVVVHHAQTVQVAVQAAVLGAQVVVRIIVPQRVRVIVVVHAIVFVPLAPHVVGHVVTPAKAAPVVQVATTHVPQGAHQDVHPVGLDALVLVRIHVMVVLVALVVQIHAMDVTHVQEHVLVAAQQVVMHHV